MTPRERALALIRVGRAMFEVNRASNGLRVESERGEHRRSPPEYYELNRIWVDLDALRKRLEAGGR